MANDPAALTEQVREGLGTIYAGDMPEAADEHARWNTAHDALDALVALLAETQKERDEARRDVGDIRAAYVQSRIEGDVQPASSDGLGRVGQRGRQPCGNGVMSDPMTDNPHEEPLAQLENIIARIARIERALDTLWQINGVYTETAAQAAWWKDKQGVTT